MSNLSRKPEFNIGDLVLLEEGIPACVYDIADAPHRLKVNWIEGEYSIHKKTIYLKGDPADWGVIKVERLPR